MNKAMRSFLLSVFLFSAPTAIFADSNSNTWIPASPVLTTSRGALPSFSALLQSSLIPERCVSCTPTFTRATTAMVWGYGPTAVIADGPILLTAASGEARFVGARRVSEGVWSAVDANGVALTTENGASALYTDANGPFGYFAEGARTNNALWSRDWTNAVWIATTATVAKDQTGADGTANSASSILATAGNATVLQTYVAASASRTFGVFAKRLTGTGAVSFTADGITYTACTLNTTTWVLCQDTHTLLNPVFGAKLDTSGDKIAVDMAMLEDAGFTSSPIPATTVAVTRNGDVLTYPTAGSLIGTNGTAYAEVSGVPVSITGTQTDIFVSGGYPMYLNISNQMLLYDGSQRTLATAVVLSPSAITKLATSWGGIETNGAVNGVLGAVSPALFDGDLNLGATLNVIGGTGNQLFGTIRKIRFWLVAMLSPKLSLLTAFNEDFMPYRVAWLTEAANDDEYLKSSNGR